MKTQIYATFGPACGDEKTLIKMINAGMTGMRLNLSHTTLPESKDYISAYQSAARKCGVNPQILIDMQGPELRVGALEDALTLCEGESVFLYAQSEIKNGQAKKELTLQKEVRIPVPNRIILSVEVGDKILIDDGKLLLEILSQGSEGLLDEELSNDEVNCVSNIKINGCIKAMVLRGGVLKSHKSIKIQDRNIKMPVLTAHDIENIRLANEYGVTALMQPFVLCGEDLAYVRDVLKENGAENIQIFAKIENRLGVEYLDDILPQADVVVIARGDLGNDMPLWELPAVQKQIENKCKEFHKPYIVVTQMLASMEHNPVPTRAEVSDIFHAVYHGAWGVMITGESAIGKYPVEAVKYLCNTAREVEKYS